MNAWKWLGKICSLTPWMKRGSLKVYYAWKSREYQKKYAKVHDIQPHTVIFESFMGKKYACSPKAFYEAMMKEEKYVSWEKVWAFREPGKYRFLEENPRTKVVKYRSREYYQAYGSGKYWITNSRLPRELSPKKGQEYIQCWHGTPLKKLGYDLEQYAEKEGSLQEVRENYIQETKRVTHMPSPSPFYSEKMCSAFHLREMGKEEVLLEMGYPRNDALYREMGKERGIYKEKLGIPRDKKVILYAPTWRENQHIPGEGYSYSLQVDFQRWKQELGEEYVILFRAHYFISNQYDFEPYGDFIKNVSDIDDVNELYLAADILITDYSSVFFDFANLERPILFYMYDYESYKHELRDFYLDIHILPGPVVKTQEELLKNIKNIHHVVDKYEEKYIEFNRIFNPHRNVCSGKYLREWLK